MKTKLKLPTHNEEFRRSDIVKAIEQLNPCFHKPYRASWSEQIPDLENPITRDVVRVELLDFDRAWKDCLYYQANGAQKIHLVLSSKAFLDYEDQENILLQESLCKAIDMYLLPPVTCRRIRRTTKDVKLEKGDVRVKIQPEAVLDPLEIPVVVKPTGEIEVGLGVKVVLDKSFKPPMKRLDEIKRDGKYCVDCESFVEEGETGSCKEYKWTMNLDLARRDTLCMV